MKLTQEIFEQRQALPLDLKIKMTERRIRSWYNYWNGNIYVAFSGGKDSTVLLDIVRKLYPNIPAVFANTGLEYPEIVQFVRTISNVITIRPKILFNKVIEKYGYPVISKEVSMGISRYRNTKFQIQKELRLYGGINPSSGKKQKSSIPYRWHFLVDAPFKISDACCDVMKKNPFHLYNKNGGYAIIALMATESRIRKMFYLKTGCNAFDKKIPISQPLSFWTEQDVLNYILTYNLNYAKIYGDIVDKGGGLITTGERRTGCMFCMFGVHLEDYPNRFQRMKETHPKHYNYCINKLGCGKVLDYIGVRYT